jgi:hypothetical protein
MAMGFWDYWKGSSGRYLVDTYDWKSSTSRGAPTLNVSGVKRGDIVSYVTDAANGGAGFDGSTWTDIDHTAIVTGINSHSTLDSSFQGTLTCQHTNDHYRVAYSGIDRYSPTTYKKFGICVWGLSDSVTSGYNPPM